ncbi:hypothetical protein CHS0354_017090 [Potamilus streckersoni]|uniref:Uncharacterized protein n=1 Tax=Potamilus streckersoni TaxID=2493646 RepID=A0AAE0VT26_9BIVA|nr:hypothetical protein CHS0354_017090 [Potamilus streckersoni]
MGRRAKKRFKEVMTLLKSYDALKRLAELEKQWIEIEKSADQELMEKERRPTEWEKKREEEKTTGQDIRYYKNQTEVVSHLFPPVNAAELMDVEATNILMYRSATSIADVCRLVYMTANTAGSTMLRNYLIRHDTGTYLYLQRGIPCLSYLYRFRSCDLHDASTEKYSRSMQGYSNSVQRCQAHLRVGNRFQ